MDSSPDRVKPKTIKLVFIASPLVCCIKEREQRLVGLEQGMCPSGATMSTWGPVVSVR
jgi:hypothetical protein